MICHAVAAASVGIGLLARNPTVLVVMWVLAFVASLSAEKGILVIRDHCFRSRDPG
jgi:hypothetical protein